MIRLAILLTCVTVSACGRWPEPVRFERLSGAAERQALLLSAAPPPFGRSCSILVAPLPPATRLLDAGRLTDAVADLPESRVLLSLRFDSAGAATDALVIEHTPGADIAEVVRHVRDSMKPQDGLVRWRLEVVTGEKATMRVGYSEACAPRLLDQEAVERFTEDATPPGLEGRAVVRFRVEADGSVGETRIAVASGRSAVDERSRQLAARLRFEPGLIDGIPAAMWAELPLEFRTVRSGR